MCELIGICRPLYPILRNYTYLVAHKTTTKRKHTSKNLNTGSLESLAEY